MEQTDSLQEVISIQHLWAGYNGEPALEDINLSVMERDFIGLVGPNGGGKTTLLKVILGLLPPTRGEVRIMGMSVKEGRRYIGYVPQTVGFDQDFPISVREVARMGRLGSRRLLKSYTIEDDEIVEEMLRQVEMLDLAERPIGALSGGQRQRVYIARALVTKPKILLLDEPAASIEPRMTATFYDLLERLNERITILMVSHDMHAVSSYVKTVGCINHRLFYHAGGELTEDMLSQAYQCPIDLIAHGLPHRVFPHHQEESID